MAGRPAIRATRRRSAALCLAAPTCAVAQGAAAPHPADAAGAAQTAERTAKPARTQRTLRISVNRPSTVHSGSAVTVRRARGHQARVIKGGSVTFRWLLPEGARTRKRPTDADGLATARRVIRCDSVGELGTKAVVTARWHGPARKVIRRFTIIGDSRG